MKLIESFSTTNFRCGVVSSFSFPTNHRRSHWTKERKLLGTSLTNLRSFRKLVKPHYRVDSGVGDSGSGNKADWHRWSSGGRL